MHQRPQCAQVTQLEPGDRGALVKDMETFINVLQMVTNCKRSQQFLTKVKLRSLMKLSMQWV